MPTIRMQDPTGFFTTWDFNGELDYIRETYRILDRSDGGFIYGFELFDEFYGQRFSGSGFTFDANGALTGGTLTGMSQIRANLDIEVWSSSFAALSAKTVFDAFLSSNAALFAALGPINFDANRTTTAADYITLGATNDTLRGWGGDDRMDGGSGADFLEGWTGNDTLFGGFGDDLFYGNSGNDQASGGDGVDTIYAAEDNDTLDGGAGADFLFGGAGDDIYYVDDVADRVTEEDAAGGADHVFASASFTLGANVERLTLTGTAAAATGNAIANVLTGNASANTLDGLGGADTMTGGGGADVYRVDDARDQVVEAANDGVDRVLAAVSYTLAENVENLALRGSSPISGTGNALANHIVGNSARNVLDGRGGADTLEGGAGDDLYAVDSLSDRVVEAKGEGVDTVFSSVSLTLAANVERLTLNGTAPLDATGNELANVLTGNAARNVLDGRGGGDTMKGGDGDDLYSVESKSDKVVEAKGEGRDEVFANVTYKLSANVEDLTLNGSKAINGTGNGSKNEITGNTGRNELRGDDGADRLSGGKGDDRLIGGDGADRLNGGAGKDRFVYLELGDSVTKADGRDVILDFQRGSDRIDLSALDAKTGVKGDQDFHFIGSKTFSGDKGELRFNRQDGGVLVTGDGDGDRKADFAIFVDDVSEMTKADFFL